MQLQDWSLRRCLRAGIAQYWVNGAVTAAIASQLPRLAERLDLTFGDLGWVLGIQAGVLIGAVVAAERLAASGFGARFGRIYLMLPSDSVARMGCLGTLAFAAVAWLPALARSPLMLAGMLAAVAIGNGPLDACVPATVAGLERRRGTSSFSIAELGFVTGGACGGLAALAAGIFDLGVGEFLGGVAIVALVVADKARRMLADSWRDLPPDHGEEEQSEERRGSRRLLVLIAAVAFVSLWSEGALIDWSSFLFQDRGYEDTYVVGYISFTVGLSLVLILGGRLIDRRGPVPVTVVGGITFALGVAIALAFESLPIASAGLFLAGVGLGNIHPAAMSAAGGIRPRARSISTVTALSYTGLVLSKPTIGGAAEAYGLRTALSMLVVFGLLMAFLAPAVRGAESGGAAPPPDPGDPRRPAPTELSSQVLQVPGV